MFIIVFFVRFRRNYTFGIVFNESFEFTALQFEIILTVLPRIHRYAGIG